jgi:two-component system capsular synthesis response regulator RcsB
MSAFIKIAILEDHLSVVDGYMFRLRDANDMGVVGVTSNGEELTSLLKEHIDIDVLIMDVHAPVSPNDSNFFPILYLAPRILEEHPNIRILIISMVTEAPLIRALIDIGINGYILKDDSESIRKLPAVIRNINRGELYFSETVKDKLGNAGNRFGITNRQLEILSLCAAYPDLSSDQLAERLGVASSSLRTTLSETYARLDVHNKAAAISRAKDLGLIS